MSTDSLLTQFPEIFKQKNYKEFKNLSLMRGFNYLIDENNALKHPFKYYDSIKLHNKGKVNNNVINEKIDINFLSKIQQNNKKKDITKKVKKPTNLKKTKSKKN